MRKLLILCGIAAIITTGCAIPKAPPLAVAGLETSAAAPVEDLRPVSETQKEIFSLLITSEAYGIYRVPESSTTPTAIRLLTHRVHEKFPDFSKTAPIKVNHLVTYANFQSQLRWGAFGAALAGPIGAVLASQSNPPRGEVYTIEVDSGIFQQTASDEHRRAFYTENENPSKTPINVIYIDTEILGRRIASRSIVPPLKDKPNPTLAEVIDICISNHLALYKANTEQAELQGKVAN